MISYLSEQQLWNQIREGNNEAVERLFDLYADSLFAYGVKFTSDKEFVKDAVQNLFLRLMISHEHLSEVSNVKSYMIKSLRRELLKNSKHGYAISFDNDNILKNKVESYASENLSVDDMDDEAIRIRRILSEELLKLPPRQKEALYLRYVQQIPLAEIAHILDMNYQSVRNLIYRAFTKLRKNIDQDKFTKSYVIILLTQVLSDM